MKMQKRTIVLGAISAIFLLGGAAGCDKALEPYQDAEIAKQDLSPAESVNMPDGFSNIATKCNHGNRVYTIYKGDALYGSVAVVPQDPTCVGGAR